MRSDLATRTVLVQLPACFVEALLEFHASLNTEVTEALGASVVDSAKAHSESPLEVELPAPLLPGGKYGGEFLGVHVVAWTLPEIFAQFVDMTAKVAPEALDKLAGMSARRRRFVARNPEAIHPGNRHLPITRTASGWWISKNIGQEDLKRALRALCDAAGLTFGADVKFLGAVKRRAAWERRNGLGNNDVTAQPHPA